MSRWIMRPETAYYRVDWHQSEAEFPVILYMALDEDRFEVRKVEVWADGSVQTSISVDDEDRQSTALSTTPTPELVEIERDPQFTGSEITAEEFNEVWVAHRGHS